VISRILLIGVLVAAPLAAQSTALPDSTDAAYEILVCRGQCTFENRARVVVEGYLVLLSLNIPVDSTSNQWRRQVGWISLEGIPNGCFDLKVLVAGKTFAGMRSSDLTRWSRLGPDSVRVILYRSPDAVHEARLAITGSQLVGRGRSSGGGFFESIRNSLASRDYIIARSLQRSELTSCPMPA